VIEEDSATGQRRVKFIQGPLFATWSWPTKSIVHRQKRSRAAARPCRKRSHRRNKLKLDEPFLVRRRRIRSNRKALSAAEAQQDRFMFNIYLGYPDEKDEIQIGMQTTVDQKPD